MAESCRPSCNPVCFSQWFTWYLRSFGFFLSSLLWSKVKFTWSSWSMLCRVRLKLQISLRDGQSNPGWTVGSRTEFLLIVFTRTEQRGELSVASCNIKIPSLDKWANQETIYSVKVKSLFILIFVETENAIKLTLPFALIVFSVSEQYI